MTHLVAVVVAGLIAVVLRLPPLLGFPGAGLLLNVPGVQQVAVRVVTASAGVMLMLFAMGLKLDVKVLLGK